VEINPIFLFVAIFGIALLFNIPLSKLKIPPIIGYIVTGVVVTNIIPLDHHYLEIVAEVGIVLLMFLIGLEFSIEKLKLMKREVFLFGTLEMSIVGLVLGGVFTLLFSLPFKIAVLVGGGLALSSTAIVLKLLNENREVGKPYGRVVVGILLFQDIAVIPLLIAISIIANKDQHLLPMVLRTAGAFIVLGLFTYFYGRYLAPLIIKAATKTKSDEIFIVSILVVVLIAASVAHLLNLSYTLGAFLGGMVLSETQYKYQIEANLIPFRDLLLGIFFVSVGLNIDLKFALSHLWAILGLTVGVMVLKIVAIYFILKLFKTPTRVSIKSAFALSQIGEFAFVIFTLLLQSHLIPSYLAMELIVAAVISMILTPFIVTNLYKIADLFEKKELKGEVYQFQPAEVSNHIIIIGYEEIGEWVAHKLTEQAIPYVAVDRQIENVERGIERGDNVVFGNGADPHLLRELSVETARAVIVTTLHQEHTQLILENVTRLNPNVEVIALANSQLEEELYRSMKKVAVINPSRLIARRLIETILQILNSPKSQKG